ncbi:MAG: integrating conjugative element protein [Gammaproteobacteria bacterium RIFCSPHIGHO2_12_FULL_37_14]|nr:MAG: integrating conjugative element protein [Gammaproteobacteria bacterium RIFCSPHIGHO2_12_FULL_37_14]
MIFNSWKILDQKNTSIKYLWAFIALLIVMNLFLAIGLMSAPNRLRVYVPPDLSHGAMINPEHIPKSVVYAFAFQIFTSINSWSNAGSTQYEKNINSYRNYLSASFYQELQKDNTDRAANGELSRDRIMSGASGMGYKPSDVTVLGDGTWLVNMHLQIVETLEGSVIKNVIMDYPMLVSRVNASISVNPWSLVISGFNQQPYRIKTII